MPRYEMSGATTTRRIARRRGVAAILAVTVLGAAALGYQHRGDGRIRIQILTAGIGSGIVDGSPVELDGVPIGRVERIDHAAPGRQRLTLALRPTADLTTAFTVEYAPANLFGISEIALRPGAGGAALRDGALLDLTAAERTVDATMGRLLEQLTRVTGPTTTPEFVASLEAMATESQALAPLFEAMVATARTVTDSQRYAPSYLLGQYASALRGMASLVGGSVTLLDNLSHIPVLRTDRALFDHSVDVITDAIVPAASRFGLAAQRQLGPYADLMAPLLEALAATVPDPNRSGAQLRELLERLDGAFTDTPDGPALDLEVVPHTGGGGR